MRKGIRSSTLACVVAAMLSAGCASVEDERYLWSEGWREGTVKQIVPLEKLRPSDLPRCEGQESLVPQAPTWVLIRYRMGGMQRMVVAPMERPDEFKVGDAVYVNARSCLRELRPRIRS